jgi:hypothetical protein
MKSVLLTAGLMGLFCYLPAQAEVDFSGYVEGELRLYPANGPLQEQREAMASLAAEPELSWKSASEDHSLRFKAFGRYSDPDGHRDHADIRELYYNYAGSGWQIEAGINKVYWGVVESLHLVDVINQTDVVESTNGDAKLGQPMVSFGLEQSWGNLDLYALPYFRERVYAAGPERFRPSMALNNLHIDLNERDAFYESSQEEQHIDYAARWANNFDNLDVGISVFSGTNREAIPVILAIDLTAFPQMIPTKLGVYYEQLDQGGLELQYLYDDWAFKFEGTARQLATGNYNSAVTGFEYTLSDVQSSGADLGLLLEYMWNDRDRMKLDPLLAIFVKQTGLPVTTATLASMPEMTALASTLGNYMSPFEDDIFLATRFALNDIGSTEFLAGVIVDADDQTTTASFEGSTRIGDNIRISLNIYIFDNVSENSAFATLENDDQFETRVAWYF